MCVGILSAACIASPAVGSGYPSLFLYNRPHSLLLFLPSFRFEYPIFFTFQRTTSAAVPLHSKIITDSTGFSCVHSVRVMAFATLVFLKLIDFLLGHFAPWFIFHSVSSWMYGDGRGIQAITFSYPSSSLVLNSVSTNPKVSSS